ncbi:MAG: hypothetical protein IPM06_17330 [Rhizobiales bacterium]|nr:hypothetical protein [Hyphomicrobiales bacterium]
MIIVKKGRSEQLDANKGGKQRLDVYLGAAIRAQLDADAVAAGKLPSEILRESYELWRVGQAFHATQVQTAVIAMAAVLAEGEADQIDQSLHDLARVIGSAYAALGIVDALRVLRKGDGDTSAVDHAYDILRRVHIMEVRRAAAQRGIVVDIGFSGELITETPPTATGRCPVCDGRLRPGSWLDSGDGGMEHGRMCPSCSLIWVEGWTALD